MIIGECDTQVNDVTRLTFFGHIILGRLIVFDLPFFSFPIDRNRVRLVRIKYLSETGTKGGNYRNVDSFETGDKTYNIRNRLLCTYRDF